MPNAYCGSCENHLDMQKANASIDLFARLVLANGRMVGKIIENDLKKKPGEVASYDDLWRFTLLAYNAGPGCFEKALLSRRRPQNLTWSQIKSGVSQGCLNGIYYSESIAIQ